MNALLRKEIRLILPAWIAAMVLATLPVWVVWPAPYVFVEGPGVLVFVPFGFGVLLLALTPFGKELSLGTFSMLLAQPASRRHLWLVKTSLLAMALGFAFIALCLSNHFRVESVLENLNNTTLENAFSKPIWVKEMLERIADARHAALHDSLVIGGLSALAGFAGGLWTTLLFRQVSAAFWLALLVPLSLGLFVSSLLAGSFSQGIADAGLIATLGLYSAAGFLWARRYFLRAQDMQWTGGILAFPRRRAAVSERQRSALPPKRKPLRALIRKEFQAQHISLLLAVGVLVFHLATLAVRKFSTEPLNSRWQFAWEAVPLLWLMMPWLVGCLAVAEERQLGTLEGQLCLPVTRRVQFATKFGLVLLLGVLLGGIVPTAVESVGAFLLQVHSDIVGKKSDTWAMAKGLLALPVISAVVVTLSLYASTLSRNLLQALSAAVVTIIAFWALGAWAVYESDNDKFYFWKGPLIEYIGLPVLVAAVVSLALANFRLLQVGRRVWFRNFILLGAAVLVACTATTLIYQRSWEWVMPLEPRHGPARLSGSIRPKICFAGVKMFALLPDGRLWAATGHANLWLGEYHEPRQVNGTNLPAEKVMWPFPADGMFLGGSNWVDAAGSRYGVVGIRSDGTLWNVFARSSTRMLTNVSEIPMPRRIGTDSNWKSVAAGSFHFLALKGDGSIWGWGNNEGDQLGPGPKMITNDWAQVGTDSNWIQVFASRSSSYGVKHDGSVWKWGDDWRQTTNSVYGALGSVPHAEPVRRGFEGTNWLSIFDIGDCEYALRSDGTFWFEGLVPKNLLGSVRASDQWQFLVKPMRVGSDSDWSDIVGEWRLAGLKRSGAIFENPRWAPKNPWGQKVWQMSKYSDWTAIGAEWDGVFAAIAADGTVCFWEDPYQQSQHSLPLGPTRKPLWSVNIFAVTK